MLAHTKSSKSMSADYNFFEVNFIQQEQIMDEVAIQTLILQMIIALYKLYQQIQYYFDTMALFHAQNHMKEADLRITGWQESILKPKNMNITQLNVNYAKNMMHINRKQYIYRRRKNQKKSNYENYEFQDSANDQFQVKMDFAKKYSTINNDNYSSINQLKKQMQNIQKIKDRWQQICIYTQMKQQNRNGQISSKSGMLKPNSDCFDEQNQDLGMTRTFVRQISSCRSNRKSPYSSMRENEKRSITLSQKNNERSKTIHSRGSNRMLSCKNRNLKLKSKSNKINITINQFQGKKMQSILKILWNHL